MDQGRPSDKIKLSVDRLKKAGILKRRPSVLSSKFETSLDLTSFK